MSEVREIYYYSFHREKRYKEGILRLRLRMTERRLRMTKNGSEWQKEGSEWQNSPKYNFLLASSNLQDRQAQH